MIILQSRTLLIYSLLIVFCSEANGQHPFHNQLSFASLLNVGPVNEARSGEVNFFNAFAVDYSRRFNHIIFDIAASRWNARIFGSSYNFSGVFLFMRDTSEWVGSLLFRNDYRFVDVSSSYQFTVLNNITIAGGIGPSLTWGHNGYVAGYFYSTGIPDYVIWTVEKNETRWGLLADVDVTYSFLHARMSAGIICKQRWYPGYFHQFELGIQTGLNF